VSVERQRPHAEGRDPIKADRRRTSEQEQGGAESYGGDPDTEPSVTEEEVDAGMERDQPEG
jgi:hypothetical protein